MGKKAFVVEGAGWEETLDHTLEILAVKNVTRVPCMQMLITPGPRDKVTVC